MRHFGQRIHDCRRNSKTFEQIAQKRTKKFGNSNFDGSRKRSFARQLKKFAERTLKIFATIPKLNEAIYFLIWEPYQKNINTLMKKVLT